MERYLTHNPDSDFDFASLEFHKKLIDLIKVHGAATDELMTASRGSRPT